MNKTKIYMAYTYDEEEISSQILGSDTNIYHTRILES